MPFTDLLRLSVFLTAGAATVLAAVTALAAGREDDTTTLLVALGWWTLAALAGARLGAPERAAGAVRDLLSRARTATALPQETEARIALGRLWPIAVFAAVAGSLGAFFPGVAAVGAGWALLVALAWRTREAVVLGVEQRDGVRFYVQPSSALRPIELVRTPGLGSEPGRGAKPPPPPPAAA
jgi:hypothetical protein